MAKNNELQTALAAAEYLYKHSSMSLNAIAKASKDLFGVAIPLSTLRSKQNEGNWQKEYEIEQDDIVMLNKLESLIKNALEREGLTSRELLDLTNAFGKLQTIKMDIFGQSGIKSDKSVKYFGRTSIIEE